MIKIEKLFCKVLVFAMVITMIPVNVSAKNNSTIKIVEQVCQESDLNLHTNGLVLNTVCEYDKALSDMDFEVDEYDVATTSTQKDAVKSLATKSNFWDKYGSDYYYRKLNKNEKSFGMI